MRTVEERYYRVQGVISTLSTALKNVVDSNIKFCYYA